MAPCGNVGDSQSHAEEEDFARYTERLEQPLCVSSTAVCLILLGKWLLRAPETDVSQETIERWVLKAQKSSRTVPTLHSS